MTGTTPDSARHDGRTPTQTRPVTITRNWLDHAEGSVLIEFGRTRVLCAASFTEGVPRWMKGQGRGWVTAEYEMLPRSTNTRSDRESRKGKVGGRTHEISRLIGRSLRAIIDLNALGENTIVLDCDVLQADGGTRTASITGAYVALADAIEDGRRRGLLPEQRDELRFVAIPAAKEAVLKAEADKAKVEAKVGELTNQVAKKAAEYEEKDREAGSLYALLRKLAFVLVLLVFGWVFFALILPGFVKTLNEGRLKTILRSIAGHTTAPILYRDASKKLTERSKNDQAE